jgi:hypothetical protein
VTSASLLPETGRSTVGFEAGRVVTVDDDPDVRRLLRRMPRSAASETALEILARQRPGFGAIGRAAPAVSEVLAATDNAR